MRITPQRACTHKGALDTLHVASVIPIGEEDIRRPKHEAESNCDSQVLHASYKFLTYRSRLELIAKRDQI